MLSNPRDIQTNSSMIFADVALDDSYIYVCTKSGTDSFKKFNYNLEQVNNNLTILSSAAGITLVTAATAVIVSSSSNSVDFIDVNTNARRNVTSGANTVYGTTTGPQVTANQEAGVAIATRNSNGNLMKITSGQVVSTISPTSLSGAQASCIILRNSASGDLQRWLIGTNNGKIIEIDASANEFGTITLPATPAISAPTQYVVTGLAYYDDRLLVSTSYGLLYLYKYSTGELLWRHFMLDGGAVAPTNGPVIASASGIAVIGSARANQGSSITELIFNTSNPVQTQFINMDMSTSFFTNIRLNPFNNKAVFLSSAASVAFQLRTFDISLGTSSEPVDLQDPVGVRVPGRIIRILDEGIGKSSIDLDTNVTEGTYPYYIPTRKNKTYIEIALVNSGTKWDIREFTS